MDIELKKRKELFEKELNKLINDFSKKKKSYYSSYKKLCWAIVIANACVSFSLGISFIESLANQFKVIALFFSSFLLILNGAMGFLNYKSTYLQRTKTLVRLLSLRRECKWILENDLTDDKLRSLMDKLELIMQDDLLQWTDNVPQDEN